MSITTLPPFKVGQVIFLIPNGERRVMPAQVTEEILKRSLAGEETVWMIQLAGSETSVPVDPGAAEYFTSVDELRKTLVTRTTEQINAMLDRTVAAANEAFKGPVLHLQEPAIPSKLEDESLTVIMPDGTKAKVRSK